MRLLLSILLAATAIVASAQDANVAFLEQRGNNAATCVFSVTTPIKDTEVTAVDGKAKLKPNELACREVLNTILFTGVENYNNGNPLVANTNDAYARSLVNPKAKAFMTYFKVVEQENSKDNKQTYHFIVELNNFNLHRLLKMRGSI